MSAYGFSTCMRVRFAHAYTWSSHAHSFLKVIFAVVFAHALHVHAQIAYNPRPEQKHKSTAKSCFPKSGRTFSLLRWDIEDFKRCMRRQRS